MRGHEKHAWGRRPMGPHLAIPIYVVSLLRSLTLDKLICYSRQQSIISMNMHTTNNDNDRSYVPTIESLASHYA